MDKELLFDTRLVRRWMAKNQLAEKDYAAHLAQIPDCEANAENVESSKGDHSGASAD